MTLESEIYSIEAANINKETLDAMKNASSAMKQIHGGLTIDKVDQTMYVMYGDHLVHAVLMKSQGGSARTACHRRGDKRGHYTISWQPRHRRRRTGR